MELYGVKINSTEDYECYKAVIASAVIEGFKPTKESVQILIDFCEEKISMDTLIEMEKNAL